MSMTKRYLESLPAEQQNEILGVTPEESGIDPDYEAWQSARESCSGAASEITDGVCLDCGAEDLPW